MSGGPYFPLFCAAKTSIKTVNQILQAAYDEQNINPRHYNSWVLIQTRDQEIFPMPSPLVSRFESDFVNCQVNELGSFCKRHFARTGLICNEDFGVIDNRTLEDNTLLFARWEQYTPEDDAILRLVWGDATPHDEASLVDIDLTPEDEALLRQIQGKATNADELLLKRTKEAAVRDEPPVLETLREVQDAATDNSIDDNPRSDPSQPDIIFFEEAEMAAQAKTPGLKPPFVQPPLESPRLSKAGHGVLEHESQKNDHHPIIEIMEGWRTVRIPITTAMRDTSLIFRRSITDLLKIRSLFDANGILRY